MENFVYSLQNYLHKLVLRRLKNHQSSESMKFSNSLCNYFVNFSDLFGLQERIYLKSYSNINITINRTKLLNTHVLGLKENPTSSSVIFSSISIYKTFEVFVYI